MRGLCLIAAVFALLGMRVFIFDGVGKPAFAIVILVIAFRDEKDDLVLVALLRTITGLGGRIGCAVILTV